MNTTRETSRNPNYYKDIEYGKVAENDFLERVAQSCMDFKCFDVRQVKEYQNCDVDFVITLKKDETLPDYNTVINSKDYKKIEVKLDSRGLYTGNFPYELMSHASSGWCVTTKCDGVYLVLVDRDSNVIRKRAWIFMDRWHNYCADREKRKKPNNIQSEDIVDLLCNMNDMARCNVLKWI